MKELMRTLLTAAMIATLLLVVEHIFHRDAPLNLAQLAHEMSVQAGLPKKIDSETLIESLTGEGDTLVVTYKLVNFTQFELPPKLEVYMRQKIKDMFCQKFMQEKQMQTAMSRQKIKMDFKFYNADDMILQSFVVDGSSCTDPASVQF